MFGFGKKVSTGSLQEVKHWYADRYQHVTVQRNILFLIAIVCLFGLLVTVFVLFSLMKSKTFEPYVIEVEEKTGITTTVDRSSVERYSADEMVKRYFISKYVTTREGYDVGTYTYNYGQVVRLLSASDVYREFRKFISVENPRSPLNLERRFRREVLIKSITFLEPKKAQIRVMTRDIALTQEDNIIENHGIITLDFDFLDLALKNEERYINPLGFQVKNYVREEDVL